MFVTGQQRAGWYRDAAAAFRLVGHSSELRVPLSVQDSHELLRRTGVNPIYPRSRGSDTPPLLTFGVRFGRIGFPLLHHAANALLLRFPLIADRRAEFPLHRHATHRGGDGSDTQSATKSHHENPQMGL
jgi:hypothetical protein